ncbi:metallo-beta-lactamase [Eubacterium sulci ATCC 35585]|jgi:putative flavoprotein|nr:metallo-beta-lactamase [Eubacterium sulci ATCC 35585]MBF1141878.1 anaerobic nitric oxide reductase flavorubredoxin [[Eubacterium] sulci]EUC78187.1 anaerobic nitric oxide reductase flavorubredoxin [Eubacterium sulci ATCC 35585]MBF1147282.1 anaerobic nitric oxide reductase flavorubredoxin [[Eubacterium] sulci]MBF1150151.1 anaerobic nitric oxide reductase flavorubredoxin [[Eubacterium] sulci]
MSKRVTDKVTWVGKIDWELKKFHGDELSTMEGSSYNSYLIRDKKTVLIDTVWGPYDTEFVNRLKEEIDLKEIDYIVMNHNESDHSGTLPALMREIPDTPIYCTKKGESILRGLYHQDWNYVNVKTGDELEIGDSKLVFVEASMLHWPDTMMTYMTGDNILFSNDVFGQHYASEMLYDDMDDISKLLHEAEKYYTNIITPFSTFVTKKLAEVQGMNLKIDLVAPSHGIIWRENIGLIMDLYAKWANNYQEDQITLIYDTMWQSTRKMAEAIAEGIQQASPNTTIKILNAVKNDKNDILVEVFKSKAILVGSPTINNGFSYAIAGILEMIKGLKFKNKKAASFGSYGWSGEAAKLIREFLEESKFAIVNDGIRVNWAPDQETIEQLREYGRKFVEEIAE